VHAQRKFPESEPPFPPGWSLVTGAEGWSLASVTEVTVTIAIQQRNIDQLEKAFWQVSDPTSSEYGKHWSLEEVSSAVDCRARAEIVRSWIASTAPGADIQVTFGGEFIRAKLPHSIAEFMFGVNMTAYCHSSGVLPFGLCRLASVEAYSVPAHVADHIEFVSGLRLPRMKLPAPSAHHFTKQSAARSAHLLEPGMPNITVVEARDRAFQVHANLLITNAQIQQHCGPTASWDSCDIVQKFETNMIPTVNGEDYLRAVNVSTPFSSKFCSNTTSDTGTILSCVIVVGPDVALVNYVATKIRMRVRFTNGLTSDWHTAPMFGFPTKGMTVNDVRKLYSMPEAYKAPAPEKNSQAVINFLGISIDEKDTRKFQRLMGSRTQPQVQYHGINNSSQLTDVEGSIDVQWIQGIGRGVPTIYHTTPGGESGHEPFLSWLMEVCNETSPALVQSLSYGENEDSYSATYQQRGDIELIKLGLRGVSVLVATGDTGVQGAAQAGGADPQCNPFVPVWPASSPYATSVGGTQFSSHTTGICDIENVYSYGTLSGMPFSCPDDDIGEIACSADTGAMITTGGGFSNRYGRPKYQEQQVNEYLTSHDADQMPPSYMFNGTGRGYPDISAISQNIPTVFAGQTVMVGGTSAAAPIASGVISSLNGARLATGLPPLGFLNPLLYMREIQAPETYIDIRYGNNSGGNRLGPVYTSCDWGFRALPGWDAATGLGSLNFDLLFAFVTNSSL